MSMLPFRGVCHTCGHDHDQVMLRPVPAASPVQGATSLIDCPECSMGAEHDPSCPRAATSSASGAKGAAVPMWQRRISDFMRDDHKGYHRIGHERAVAKAMLAEIVDLRAAIADRSPAVQPVAGQAKIVATVIKNGADRQWMSEALGELPDGLYSLCVAATPAPEQEAAPQLDEALATFLAEHTRLNQDGIDTHAMKMVLALNYAALNPVPESDIEEWREQGYLAPVEQEAAQVVAKADERGWLIEVKGLPKPMWLMADGSSTADANESLRFSRERDASGFLQIFLTAKFGDDAVGVYKLRLGKTCYHVTEHIWQDAAPVAQEASQPEPKADASFKYEAKGGSGKWFPLFVRDDAEAKEWADDHEGFEVRATATNTNQPENLGAANTNKGGEAK